ncbi:MAG: hypothetical protein LBU61_05730 [Coriobacteriales bacterium]|nr:hypothetical protein [Coriobacteriales bacterium]
MAISMSPKENFLACMAHKPHEYTPCFVDMVPCGLSEPFERGPGGSGIDAFGVRWVTPLSGGPGSALPAPGEFLLEDVTKWKSIVKIPDVSSFDWQAAADAYLANVDRDMLAMECVSQNHVYERLATLMGFEGALLALALEPEATFELLEAICDWKIEMLKYYVKYFKPDMYTYCDDVATERMLFMSPGTYRDLIKPLHTRMVNAVKELGLFAVQHTCGKADLIVEDMIDEGNDGWGAVQPTNDIAGIIEKYGDKFVLIGGYNTNFGPGLPTATEEEARAEVRRCMEEYGKYGKGFIFMGMIMTALDPADPMAMNPVNGAIFDEFFKIRAEKTA